MDTLTDAIKTRALTILDTDGTSKIKHFGLWNNQISELEPGSNYAFPLPALFIEYLNTNETGSVGGGVQVYEPLDIVFHILHNKLNADNGEMERNRDVNILEKETHAKFYKWKTDGSGYFDRVGIDRDYDHDNVYHLMPKYRTTWVDNDLAEPLSGIEKAPPFTTDITKG